MSRSCVELISIHFESGGGVFYNGKLKRAVERGDVTQAVRGERFCAFLSMLMRLFSD